VNRNQRRAAAKQNREASPRKLPEDSAASESASSLFATAVARHRSSRFAEAEALYRRVLALAPDHAESYHLLGVLAHQLGRGDAALALISKAISLKGDDPAFHGNLGNVLRAQGKLDESVAAYRRALALNPDFADAFGNLGNALKDQGKSEEAIASYRRALALKPDFADAHNNLGVALKDQGEQDEAIASYRKALALRPDFADAHNNLGVALKDQGKRDEAEACYRLALDFEPNLVSAQYNLGNVLKERGKLEEAVPAYRRALQLRPDLANAHNNLGNALRDQGKPEEAAACYRRVLALRPDLADAHNNLGAALKDLGKLDEATSALRQALALRPAFAEAFGNLGNVLKEQGRLDEALVLYERALELKPDFAEAHSNLVMSQHYQDRISNAELLAAALRFGRRFEEAAPARNFSNDGTGARRLRIGYVSGDFRRHPVGYFLAGVLAAHDPAAVEVFCYANQVKTDDMTLRLREAADHWRGVAGLSDADAAALVMKDGVDILIDLAGHTAKNRLPLFALRAAPVQVSWLGYFGTTGLGAMDYLLMDEWAAPAGAERWCAEALVRLPHGRFCYAPPDYAPEVADSPALRNGHVTFGSFNNVVKIGPDVVRLWAAVLAAAARARLMLKWKSLDDENERRRLREAFTAAGVDPARLELRGFSPHREMLAEYGDIDVALDPFPFGGGLTSCEALWMGVPVVTLPGDRPASRQTVGFLDLLGLSDCVATSPADYVARCIALAADHLRLADLRRSIRARMMASPLCDGPLFARALEAAYREMWRRWTAGLAAAPFDVAG
jgi:predicted O-linked N-acetylglucosamine transferase (SPINDLY family)